MQSTLNFDIKHLVIVEKQKSSTFQLDFFIFVWEIYTKKLLK